MKAIQRHTVVGIERHLRMQGQRYACFILRGKAKHLRDEEDHKAVLESQRDVKGP